MTNPLSPVQQPYSRDIADALARYPQRDGYVLKLFRVFANSRRFLSKGVVNLLDRDSPLSMREREIVILRVCANLRCEYEWGVHVTAFAGHVGLTAPQINATANRINGGEHAADDWSESEQLLLDAMDQLCDRGRMSAATLKRFQAQWNAEQQLEILALCGNYHTVAFVANTSQLSNEEFGVEFPSAV